MEHERKEQEIKLAETFKVETVDPKEAERVLAQTEIHGDDFGGRRLTPEVLKKEGLEPKHKIQIECVDFWLSSAYEIHDGRVAIIAYVKKDKEIVARSYYFSNSAGLWRYLPAYIGGGGRIILYDKGYGEDSCAAPLAMQKMLSEIGEKETLKVQDPDFVFGGTTIGPESPIGIPYDYKKEIDLSPFKLEGDFRSERERYKIPPEETKFTKEEQSPDFSKLLMNWKQKSGIYGETSMEIYPSRDGSLRYLFCSDNAERVWIGGIEVVKSEIGSTGLRKSWVDGGDLTTPAYEYVQQAGGYGNYQMRQGRHYVDMFKNYLSKIPVIQEYLAKKNLKRE